MLPKKIFISGYRRSLRSAWWPCCVFVYCNIILTYKSHLSLNSHRDFLSF